MDQTLGPAATTSTGKVRSLGSHRLPGVDVALTAFPEADTQRLLVQSLLDSTLLGTLCLTADQRIEVTLDNVGAGHFWPSGATPDRRAWIELTAYSGGAVMYQSGAVPLGQSVETIADPDLWLIRDCLFDEARSSVHMFWEATSLGVLNQIPGPVKPNLQDPTTFTRSHLRYLYPAAAGLPSRPDRVTLKVLVKPIGDDVLQDLVASGDLDPTVASQVPTFALGEPAAMEWTAAAAQAPTDIQTRMTVPGLSCVGTEVTMYRKIPTVAVTNARCQP
jgi:hypothetical protein